LQIRNILLSKDFSQITTALFQAFNHKISICITSEINIKLYMNKNINKGNK